jgi:hypothetical protein
VLFRTFSLAKGAVYASSVAGQGCPSLTAHRYGIDPAVGGTQTLHIANGVADPALKLVHVSNPVPLVLP